MLVRMGCHYLISILAATQHLLCLQVIIESASISFPVCPRQSTHLIMPSRLGVCQSSRECTDNRSTRECAHSGHTNTHERHETNFEVSTREYL